MLAVILISPLVLAIIIILLGLFWLKKYFFNGEFEVPVGSEVELTPSGEALPPLKKWKLAIHILILMTLFLSLSYCNVMFGGAADRRPSYIQLIDDTVDERISKQITSIDTSMNILKTNKLSIEEMQEELKGLAVELHILGVLVRETADKRKKLQNELKKKELFLEKKSKEVSLLASLSESQMQTLKGILLAETQRWSYLSLILGILISIPLFWLSEFLRVSVLSPRLSRLIKRIKKHPKKINNDQ